MTTAMKLWILNYLHFKTIHIPLEYFFHLYRFIHIQPVLLFSGYITTSLLLKSTTLKVSITCSSCSVYPCMIHLLYLERIFRTINMEIVRKRKELIALHVVHVGNSYFTASRHIHDFSCILHVCSFQNKHTTQVKPKYTLVISLRKCAGWHALIALLGLAFWRRFSN